MLYKDYIGDLTERDPRLSISAYNIMIVNSKVLSIPNGARCLSVPWEGLMGMNVRALSMPGTAHRGNCLSIHLAAAHTCDKHQFNSLHGEIVCSLDSNKKSVLHGKFDVWGEQHMWEKRGRNGNREREWA